MATSNASPLVSLYQRLGGYDGIAAIVANLFELMRADPRFSRFGPGRSIDSHKRSQQLTLELLCAVSGGPCYYTGRDMKIAHAGLGITESEWDASVELAKRALDMHGVGPREQQGFLDLFERFKDDVVENS